MRKVQLGCGNHHLPGWENYDAEVDIGAPLPFPDGSVRLLLAEHVLEHVTPARGLAFLKEIHRVLEPGGTARICVPALDIIFARYCEDYGAFLREHGYGDGSLSSAVESIVNNFGHQAVYTSDLLHYLCRAAGFSHGSINRRTPLCSPIPELNEIDGHWKNIGELPNRVETAVIEVTK